MRNLKCLFVIVSGMILTSCGFLGSSNPIPKNKKQYIGHWVSRSGYELHVYSNGLADIKQVIGTDDPDILALNIPIATSNINSLQVAFVGDSLMQLAGSFLSAKNMQIGKAPYMDRTGDSIRIVLNGIDLVRRSD